MKINTALILSAGFGERLNPITLKTPKPLLKIKNQTLLDHCINLIKSLDVKKILINSFHLKDQIYKFVENHNYDIEIKIVEDGNKILDTGGGILNLIKNSNEENFLVFNPDTIWSLDYKEDINNMINFYCKNNLQNILLLVNKDLSFDVNLKSDFGLKKNFINHHDKKFIYTGCQILNKRVLKNEKLTRFSITKVWSDLIEKNKLNGFETKIKFYHVSDLKTFRRLEGL